LLEALGFTHKKTPCIATLHIIFKNIDVKLLEDKLGEWAEGVLGHSLEQGNVEDEAVSVDGKRLRGSLKQGGALTYLLSAVSHQLGLTLAQCSVDGKPDDNTNEIGAMPQVLKSLVLEGKIITADAIHTQRKTCETIVDNGGDYVLIVKENQHNLLNDVMTTFHGPFSSMVKKTSDRTFDVGHGRIEERHLTASDELPGYTDWPGLEQVFMVKRSTTIKNTGECNTEIAYGITSLTSEESDASRLNRLVRNHWHIENKSHWVRDVTFDEDRSQVRSGNIPQVMAALRNTAIGLMRWAGETNIAAACRMFAAKPGEALELIGAMEN